VNTISCARPACPGAPAAWLAYDYEARCAWIDDHSALTIELSHHWPLCERHADTLRVPRGWFCVDRRTGRAPAESQEADAEAGPEGTGQTPAGGQLSAIL